MLDQSPERAVHLRTCPLCEAMCGLEVHTIGSGPDMRVEKIVPDKADVWSKGHICPKGTTLGALHEDPDRLRTPMVRGDDGELHEATWDEAFAKVLRAAAASGRRARHRCGDGVRRQPARPRLRPRRGTSAS